MNGCSRCGKPAVVFYSARISSAKDDRVPGMKLCSECREALDRWIAGHPTAHDVRKTVLDYTEGNVDDPKTAIQLVNAVGRL